MNLRELKSEGFLASEAAETKALEILDRDREAEKNTPWVARIALGMGAWIAGISFTGFLMLLLDLNDELPTAIIGLFIAAGAVFLLRQGKGIFLEQLALALGFAGHIMLFLGLHEVHSNDLVGPFFGALILCGPVYWFSENRVQRFLSVLWVWMTGWGASLGNWDEGASVMPYLMLFASLGVVLVILSGEKKAAGLLWRPAMWASAAGLFGMLIWLSNGKAWDIPDDQMGRIFGMGAALASLGVVWHLARPKGNAAAGFGGFALLLICLGLGGAPGIVVSLGLMTIAHARNDRHLGWVAIVALAYFLIAFYYHLEIPLVQKSIFLMVSGLVFLGIRGLLFRNQEGGGVAEAAREESGGNLQAKGRLIQTVLIIANCVLVLAVVNGAILKKHRIVETGRTMFLQLAPVDPRSLMQGDYMVLRYALPREKPFQGALDTAPTRGHLILKLDENGVATFSRFVGEDAVLSENENLLSYRKWRRGLKFGIESFFFQEGLADLYSAAKFAELRVSPDGEAVLVDLRGGKREPLTSGVQSDEIPAEEGSENP